MQLLFRCFAILVTALAANWWTLIPAALVVAALLAIRWYFLKTAREVKRLEAIGVQLNIELGSGIKIECLSMYVL